MVAAQLKRKPVRRTAIAPMEFDAFGRRIIVERLGGRWASYERGADGKRRDAAFVVPPDVPESEVGRYLSDMFHESADSERPEVKRVD